MIKTLQKSKPEKIIQMERNIKINKNLLNKYNNLEEIFKYEGKNNNSIININLMDIDLKNKTANEIYHIATKIFKNNHKKRTFINDKNKINVTNQDIKESINKIYNDRLQNKYLKEHLAIFLILGNVIEKSNLVNQTIENKNRSKYITWNYYFSNLKIDNQLFNFEFDVVSRIDGENHYRVQRLEKSKYSVNSFINDEVDFGVPAYENNDTTNM